MILLSLAKALRAISFHSCGVIIVEHRTFVQIFPKRASMSSSVVRVERKEGWCVSECVILRNTTATRRTGVADEEAVDVHFLKHP
jgi:hypothetical protein